MGEDENASQMREDMAKKRSRGQGKKRSSSATGRSTSTAITEVIERIAAAGPDYFQDNFVRLMVNSATLGQEPEFAGLYFDSSKRYRLRHVILRVSYGA